MNTFLTAFRQIFKFYCLNLQNIYIHRRLQEDLHQNILIIFCNYFFLSINLLRNVTLNAY